MALNHLGLCSSALPQHKMALITSDRCQVAAFENGTINSAWMKALLTHTHTNTHNWALCSAAGEAMSFPCLFRVFSLRFHCLSLPFAKVLLSPEYSQLIGFLEDTKDFAVDGRKFGTWTLPFAFIPTAFAAKVMPFAVKTLPLSREDTAFRLCFHCLSPRRHCLSLRRHCLSPCGVQVSSGCGLSCCRRQKHTLAATPARQRRTTRALTHHLHPY